MLLIALIGTGGFLGAIMRYLVEGRIQDLLRNPSFPYGTLGVNIIGCLLIGLLAGLAESRQLFGAEARGFLLVGLLGGFTTFSTFSYETLALARDGQAIAALANVSLQVVLGFAAVWAGYGASRLA